jgi:hypothetical protein
MVKSLSLAGIPDNRLLLYNRLQFPHLSVGIAGDATTAPKRVATGALRMRADDGPRRDDRRADATLGCKGVIRP